MATVRKVLLLLMFLVLLMIMSCVYNVIMIQKIHDYLFELTLMGFLAFLVLLIDKVHNYKKELSSQRKVNTRKQPEVETTLYETTTLRRRLRQVESQLEKELKEKTVATTRLRTLVSRHEKETKERTERILLDTRLKQLESELETKKKDVRAAEANSIALRKQCDGLLYEYNRLLEENEFVKNQLRVCDWRLSHSGVLILLVRVIHAAEAKSLSENNGLLDENQILKNRLQSLDTGLDKLESDLETKTEDVISAEVNSIVLIKHSEEFHLEYDLLVKQNQILKNQLRSLSTRVEQVECELEIKKKTVNDVEAKNVSLRKQLHEFLLEHHCMLETKKKEVTAADAQNKDTKKQFDELFLEHLSLLEKNDTLNNQLQSSGSKIVRLEYEVLAKTRDLEAAEANDITLGKDKKTLEERLQAWGTKLRHIEIIESELNTRKRSISAYEAKITDLKNQVEELSLQHDCLLGNNQTLRNQLQLSHTRLRQTESKLGTKTQEVCVVKSNIVALNKENDDLKNQLRSLETT
ncbi:filamin A-interacting protein 1-like [Rosa chinensis]|uniref:filamin A-interacting protein 1-like n=1 Tax=Rosa chinensis TaxID=74649 RepID=UPI000D08E51F|nr:filamin A-interacting protein 1-like [Rosa chinensis]